VAERVLTLRELNCATPARPAFGDDVVPRHRAERREVAAGTETFAA
jgi:hypothetical protein